MHNLFIYISLLHMSLGVASTASLVRTDFNFLENFSSNSEEPEIYDEDRMLQEEKKWTKMGCIDGDFGGIEAGTSVSITGDGLSFVQGNFFGVKMYDYDPENGFVESMDFKKLITTNGRGSYVVKASDDGMRVAVGSPNHREKGIDSGAVQVFEKERDEDGNETGFWFQMGRTLTGDNPFDLFGCSVDLTTDGSRLIAGAYGAGLAKIFDYQDHIDRWTLAEVSIGSENDAFGFDVAISGDGHRIIIGAPLANDEQGYARVKDIKNFKFVNQVDGLFPGERYGTSVDFSQDGSTAALGGPGTGHVLVIQYDEDANQWSRRGIRICIEDEDFGTSVSLADDGMAVAIGAPLNDFFGPNAGHSYVFEYDERTDWQQLGGAFHGEAPFDDCGHEVTLSSDKSTTIVACPGKDSEINLGEDGGHMCIFRQSENWMFKPSIMPSNPPHSAPSGTTTPPNGPPSPPSPTVTPPTPPAPTPATPTPRPQISPTPGDSDNEPTISPAPSISFMPTISPAPTVSSKPTISPAPSISFMPTTSPAPTVSLKPTISPAPSVSFMPTISPAPSVSFMPTISFVPTVLRSSEPSKKSASAPPDSAGTNPPMTVQMIFAAVLALFTALGTFCGGLCLGGGTLGICAGCPLLLVGFLDHLYYAWEIFDYWWYHHRRWWWYYSTTTTSTS